MIMNFDMRTFLFLVFIVLVSLSCAQRVKVPVNKMRGPEVNGKFMSLGYRKSTTSQGVIDLSQGQTTNPLFMQQSEDSELMIKASINRIAEFFYLIPEESVAMFGLRVQLLGDNRAALSEGQKLLFSLATGSSRDNFNESGISLNILSDATEFGLIYGYRFTQSFMAYISSHVSNYKFLAQIQGDTSAYTSNELNYVAQNISNNALGIEWGGSSFIFKLEYAVQRIDWSNTEAKIIHGLGYGLEVSF